MGPLGGLSDRYCLRVVSSGFYPPKSEIKIEHNFLPVLVEVPPQFLTQVFPSILGFFPL